MPPFFSRRPRNPAGRRTFEDVAGAHAADLAIQAKFGVSFTRYWVDEAARKVFCLAEAPDAATAEQVHREAHGLVATRIYAVREGG